ncbi:hypothetical protein ACFYMW_38115 [Streptomyces sp. NPDC006692]|uniref:hypothetical protein n=1 Tax=unclassified Streptomyces TaxID=2593676 RepID=UPI003694E6E1
MRGLPHGPAHEAILRYHLRERPIETVDPGTLVNARNVAMYANEARTYDELLAYLKKARRL